LAFVGIARQQCTGTHDFSEDEGELLSAITFVLFGAVLAGPVLDDVASQIALYVVLSLTASGTFFETSVFLGWFGPRALASILFALIVVEELDSDGGRTIFTVAAWTVLVSVFAHGLTASAWAGRLARRLTAETDPMPEMEPVPELPTRSGPMPATAAPQPTTRTENLVADIVFENRRFDPDLTDFHDHAKAMAKALGYTADLALDQHRAELVRLRVAQINNCSYCLILHAETSRTGGIHPAKIDNRGSWWESEFFDPAEHAALA
jgi:AhpD family alkylhydroperoxidase